MKHIFIVALALTLSSSLLTAQKMKKEPGQKPHTMVGYLVDQMCGKGMVMDDIKKSDAKAAKHTKECALNEACAAKGYGLVSGGRFYKFDKRGNAKAAEYLHATKKEDHIKVEVIGMMKGSTIAVESIKDLRVPKKKPVKKI